MILQESIDEVLTRVNITEIIGESVRLRRAGAHLVGLCPFHSEKTPSFHVRETEGRYHCFGCGESGNAIHFLMKSRGLAFPDAVEELAHRIGVKLRYSSPSSDKGERTQGNAVIFEINQAAQVYFRSCFERSSEVRSYLGKRGITAKTQEMFQLGFAPDEWRSLAEHLQLKKIEVPNLLRASLVKRNQRGELFDVFRGRLMFPIAMDNRRISGFAGRLLPGCSKTCSEDSPKYMNSPETPVYHKSKILFGLPQAIEAIRKTGEVYLVEGYMDVLGLWQAGVCQTLATCGTALTRDHAQRLSRLTRRLYVLFDGDAAGRLAAGKTFPALINSGIELRAIFLPEGKDPDEIALERGTGTIDWLRGQPQRELLDCYLDYLAVTLCGSALNELGAAGKGKVAEAAAKVLGQVRNSVERGELVERTALRLRVESKLVAELVPPISAAESAASLEGGLPLPDKEPSPTVQSGRIPQALPAKSDVVRDLRQLPSLDRELIRAAMGLREEIPGAVLSDPELCMALQPVTIQFISGLKAIFSGDAQGGGMAPDEAKKAVLQLLSQYGDSWRSFWTETYKLLDSGVMDLQAIFQGCRKAARRGSLQMALEQLDRQISGTGDGLERERLHQTRLELIRKRDQLR